MHLRDSKVLSDTVLVGALTVLVKLAGAGKVVFSAHLFGAGDQLDAYLIAFLIPSFLGEVLAGSLTASLIPTLIETRERNGQTAAHELYSTVLIAATVLLCGVAAVIALGSNVVIRLLGSGFSPEKHHLTQVFFLWMAPVLPLSAISVTWRALLNAKERFAAAAAVPILTPVITIGFLFAAGRAFGAVSLAWGTLAGSAAEVLTLAVALELHGIRVRPVRPVWSDAARQVFSQYLPMAAGCVLLCGSSLIDQTMAAMLAAGSVSALNFGTRVSGVIVAVGPQALSTAILPRFSKMTAMSDWLGLRETLKRYALVSVAVSVPVTALLVYLSEPIVRLIFERGAFTAADARTVVNVQTFSLLQIPVSILLALVVRAVSSLKANELLLRMAALGLTANVVLDYVLMQKLGVAGIALSAPLVTTVSLTFLTYLFYRRAKTRILVAY
ncbi:MAG TPA: lipid II flippase MurJ [Bryobacteraceae bacterium]|nr:lipid II flippase MurJ [Bryobacteraceae bacterium]